MNLSVGLQVRPPQTSCRVIMVAEKSQACALSLFHCVRLHTSKGNPGIPQGLLWRVCTQAFPKADPWHEPNAFVLTKGSPWQQVDGAWYSSIATSDNAFHAPQPNSHACLESRCNASSGQAGLPKPESGLTQGRAGVTGAPAFLRLQRMALPIRCQYSFQWCLSEVAARSRQCYVGFSCLVAFPFRCGKGLERNSGAADVLPLDSIRDEACRIQPHTDMVTLSRVCLLDPSIPAHRRQHLFSLYLHNSPDHPGFPPGHIFHQTEIPGRVPNFLGHQPRTVAVKRLLEVALWEPLNQRFVVLSEATIPIYPPQAVYRQLLSETFSRINACNLEVGSCGALCFHAA